MTLHTFRSLTPLPSQLNNPFDYEPHPLCLEALAHLRPAIEALPLGGEGKMFGVLIVEPLEPDRSAPGDAAEGHPVCFLAAYSGQVADRSDWPGFVPAVFDYLQPDGHFKRGEAAITALNRELARKEHDPAYREALARLHSLQEEAAGAIGRETATMRLAKQLRDQRRKEGYLSAGEQAALIRESQFRKAELRRVKQRYAQLTAQAQAAVERLEQPLRALREERRQRSEALQQWLFNQFRLCNAQGDERSLTDLFADTPQGTPPSGAGECCEPKLLHYAFRHGLRPLQIGMFWWGPSPRQEVRRHLDFYPACSGKCKPILAWMLPAFAEGFPAGDATKDAATSAPADPAAALVTVYEDDTLCVVNKPAGLLSVPGRSAGASVWSVLQERWQGRCTPLMVHRLDQATSGLLVVAKTPQAQRDLQAQFRARTVYKEYTAVLERPHPCTGRGTVSLPLRPDPLNRPCQVADREQGKEAVTDYIFTAPDRLTLVPHTGRTHQLRLHCAHPEGLGIAIRGDRLYGHRADRLYLHATVLTFRHPVTGRLLRLQAPPPF